MMQSRDKFFQNRADARTNEIRRIDDEIARIKFQVGRASNPHAEQRIRILEVAKKQLHYDRMNDLFHKGRR